jgi:hypothetical protein
VLPRATPCRIGGSHTHDRVQIGKVLVGNVFTPLTARRRVDAAQIQRCIPGQQERA